MRVTGKNALHGLYGLLTEWPLAETGSEVEILSPEELTPEQKAAIYDLADASYWEVTPSRYEHARLRQVLSPAQKRVPLDELVWDTLRGVVEELTYSGQYCTRRCYYASTDEGKTQPLIDVRYRYYISGGQVTRESSTIRYPCADGTSVEVAGQVYELGKAQAYSDNSGASDGWLEFSL